MNSQDIDNRIVQFGRTASDYARHRPGFPPSFFRKLHNKGFVLEGDQILDLGTGTGTIARGLAGLGCKSFGLDPSEELLNEARRISSAQIEYILGKAESIPFEASCFDVVTAGQCWHWFDADAATKEIRRVLKPNGRLIIANFDWRPEPGNIAQVTLDLIPKHSPDWTPETRPGFFRCIPDDIQTPRGFQKLEEYVYEEPVSFTLDSWCGRVRASAAIGATLDPEKVLAFDLELRQVLRSIINSDEFVVPHFVTTRIFHYL